MEGGLPHESVSRYRSRRQPNGKGMALMAEVTAVNDLPADEIRDLYSAEKQLVKAIPKMVKGASHMALKEAFRSHLTQTEAQVARLELVAELLQFKPGGKKCEGMEGVIQEGAEALKQEGEPSILDLGLIGAGSRVEHYAMAGHLTAISLAKRMGDKEAVALLHASLAEAEGAEQKLRRIADGIIQTAPTSLTA